jgi:hypothetical protein
MRTGRLLVMLGTLAAAAAGQAPDAAAAPLGCDVQTATVCQITGPRDLGAGGTFEVDRSLHIMGAPAEIRVGAGGSLTLAIAGDLVVHPGGRITGSVTGAGARGATIEVAAAGKILLGGDGSSGAQIAADQKAGSCTTGRGGDITLRSSWALAGEAVVVQAGASVTANAECSGGAIRILAPDGKITVAGLVESRGNAPGSGARIKPGGGPITIEAGCDLSIADTGRVSSRGRDPGADLVRLAGGCDVLVAGLVESTGPGHAVPNSPPNHCAGAERPDKPASATACVEIWAGDSLTIDGAGDARGEVSADTAMAGGSKIAWIDLFAQGPITIAGPGAGPYAPSDRPYAVHANEFVSNSRGGVVTVKSVQGKVALAGRAVQADGGLGSSGIPVMGGKGGEVTIEAGGAEANLADVDLGAASVRARGAAKGAGKAGGTIAVRSFNGKILGASPGELDAGGGGTPGAVTLQACAGAEYAGASTPDAVVPAGACGGAPELPAGASLPACRCVAVPPCEGPQCQPASFCPRGAVQAALDPVTGRFPGNLGPDVVVDGSVASLQEALDSVTDLNGDGYTILGLVATGGPNPSPFGGGEIAQEITISRFYDAPFALIGCGVMIADPLYCNGVPPVRITEAAGSPAHPAGSKTTLYVLDVGVRGSKSAPGFLVRGDGRLLEEIRVLDNLTGVKLAGDDNQLRGSAVEGSIADGVVVEGSGNVVESTEVVSSGGHGIRVIGDRNRVIDNLAGSAFSGNGGDGVNVTGAGNVLRGNEAYANGGDGFDVSGGTAAAPNILRRNRAGAPYRSNMGHGIRLGGTGGGPSEPVEVQANRTSANGLAGIKVTGSGHELRDNASDGNTGCEYAVAPGNLNATGNLAGAFTVAGADGSPFPIGCIQSGF